RPKPKTGCSMECASPTIQLAGGWSRFASDAAPALPEQRLLPTANLLKAMTSFRGIALLFILLANVICANFCHPDFGIQQHDEWKPYLVASCTLFGIVLIADGLPADAVLLGLSVLFVLSGVITERQAFAGFASPGVAAYAALFILSEAFAEVKILDSVVFRILGHPAGLRMAQCRITIPVAIASAIFNNGPLVAMLVPVVQAWAQRHGHASGQLLMPLAFASTLGGTLTMIGSAANLLAQDCARELPTPVELSFFSLTPYSLPLSMVGIGYMLAAARWLLPRLCQDSLDKDPKYQRSPIRGDQELLLDIEEPFAAELRHFQILFVVRRRCPSIGSTLQELGFSRLPDARALGLHRAGEVLQNTFHTPLAHGDVLKMTASAASIARLRRSYDGLEPAVFRDLEGLGGRRRHRRLFEVVVADSSLVQLQSLAEQKAKLFQKGCVILAIRHDKGSLDVSPNRIVAGQILLLEAFPGMADRMADFSVIAPVEASKPPRQGKQQDRMRGMLCLMGFFTVIVLNGFSILPLATAVLFLDFLCCFAKVLGWREAVQSVNGGVVMTIAASFGISAALTQTGVAHALANALLGLGLGFGPFGVLCMVYIGAAFLTNIISNTATCVMMIPVAAHISEELQETMCQLSVKTLLVTVVLASNAAFATPLGSPCNILVVDAGDYDFRDFLRFGGLLQIVMMLSTCSLLYACPCA
ncbi:Putative sulfur deprivation response regulator, partial [Durusdinium trenchii]